MHLGNMDDTDPEESPKPPTSATEDVNASGPTNELTEPGGAPQGALETPSRNLRVSAGDTEGESVAIDGGRCVSRSGVGAESSVGTDEQNTAGNLTGGCGAQDDDEKEGAKTPGQEMEMSDRRQDVQQDAPIDANSLAEKADGEEKARPDEKTSRGIKAELNGKGDVKEEPTTQPVTDLTPKTRKFRLECKDCGQKFNRRETFNLHRHFHAHEDDLAPLTCKECGLTFQQRSSFIKHRSEHKIKEEEQPLLSPKEEPETMEVGSFQCAECTTVFPTVAKLRDHNCCKASEKPYHCPLCRQDFQIKISITKHMATHSQEYMFWCQECSQTFHDIFSLRQHQRGHAALKSYKCPECNMVFKHYSVMEDHRRKHTACTRTNMCNICGKTFKYSSLLHQHQYLHTGKKPFRCHECGKTFAFAQNMKAHYRQHRLHQILSSNNQKGTSDSAESSQDAAGRPGKENAQQLKESKRQVRCRLCPQTFAFSVTYRAHMLMHEEEERKTQEKAVKRPAKGAQVRDQLQNEYGLKRHLLGSHSSVPKYLENACAPQKKLQSDSKAEGAHGSLRGDGSAVKSHKCPECGKVFRHRSVLELHMRIHSKDKPYQCNICGKNFRFSSYLQQHLIVHSGKKPHKCPDCGREFAFLQNMKTHQKLHQEKPYKCTTCSKGYRIESQLKQHMLSHKLDRPHKCEQCSKSFQFAHLLRDHKNTHTGEKPHRCDKCNKSFSWFSNLLVHIKIHSRDEPLPGAGVRARGGPAPAAGGRLRGVGGRRRWGGRLAWLLPRPSTSSGTAGSQHPLQPPPPPPPVPFLVSAPTDAESNRAKAVQLPLSAHAPRTESPHARPPEEPRPPETRPPHQPVQWRVDGGEVMPAPSFKQPQQQQCLSGSDRAVTVSQSDPVGNQTALSVVVSHLAAKKSLPPPGIEPRQCRRNTRSSRTCSTALQPDISPQAFAEGAALWSSVCAALKPSLPANSQGSPTKQGPEVLQAKRPGDPALLQAEPSKSPRKRDDAGARDSSYPKATPAAVSKAEKPRSGSELQMPGSSPAVLGVSSASWDVKALAGILKTNCPEKVTNDQDSQPHPSAISSSWAGVQTQTATQKIPMSIQYDPHLVGQAVGTPVWGFQSNPVSPQTLLTGQLKPGSGQELQQQPMVTGAQIIINQTSPFFSPQLAALPSVALSGSHPLHPVSVSALPRGAHPNIFFAPQAVMSERPHMSQTVPLPQPQNLGSHVPFFPERLLQCMICGCSFSRELDLQMHYLQHAQAKI